MTTSLLDRVAAHVEEIDARAATIDAKRVLALIVTVLTFPFWVVGVVVNVAWLIIRWVFAGVLTGWDASQRVVDRLVPDQGHGHGQGHGQRWDE